MNALKPLFIHIVHALARNVALGCTKPAQPGLWGPLGAPAPPLPRPPVRLCQENVDHSLARPEASGRGAWRKKGGKPCWPKWPAA